MSTWAKSTLGEIATGFFNGGTPTTQTDDELYTGETLIYLQGHTGRVFSRVTWGMIGICSFHSRLEESQ